MNETKLNNLKAKLYSQIEQLNDEVALQLLEESITHYSSPSENDILDDLTAKQKERLQDSIAQADNGNTLSDEEVQQKAKEWLSK